MRKPKNAPKYALLASLFALSEYISGCAPAQFSFRDSANANNAVNTVNTVNTCDPTNSSGGGPNNGLLGSLYYLNPGSSVLASVDDYFKSGIQSNESIYWNNLNVPTRLFTAGFQKPDGSLLMTNSGVVLTENFALDFKTLIALSPTDAAGDYEFSLISDDGAVLSLMDSHGQMQTIVNNDGTHGSRFACANKVVRLDASTKLSAEIKYFQGPKNHIALILMWRKIAAGTSSLNEKYCGDSGNELFFDPNTVPSTPKVEYNSILGLGWKPLATANYILPGNQTNPCLTK